MDILNGRIFKDMLESGCANLNNRRSDVDALNVFPVPDGDTGTNMSLTFTNGITEVRNSGSDSLPVIAKKLSRGLLMGARGNSGVILSQIFRGFYQYVQDQEELNVKQFSEAMLNGSKLAYKAVMRPVEGTILTVVREASEAAAKYVEENENCSLNEYVDIWCKEGKVSLDHTPEILPVLKEAHVVDSGGSGLLIIFEGFLAALNGTPITEAEESEKVEKEKNEKASGYRLEAVVKLSDTGRHIFREEKMRKQLNQMGNKITLKQREDVVKLRINTMSPGEILTLLQRYGEFDQVQLENIQSELKPSIIEDDEDDTPEKEYGLISVCAGEGLKKLFKDYRTDVVVSGGQTMNPSTEDFVSAISRIHAKHIYILPNNSNIIMAAKQAADVTDGKDVIVLETKSIPQGLSACINFNPEETPEANTDAMNEAIGAVKSGSITYAIKDTTVEGREIHAGDFMAILDKEIVFTSTDKLEAVKELLNQMVDEDAEIVTLIAGSDVSEEDTAEIESYIDETFDVDVDVQNGGQPVYSYLIGVE